jgi:hypothetical protein
MAAVIAASPAQAATIDATASLSGFRFELIDLDLNDNITPSIQFYDPQHRAYAQANWSWTPEDRQDIEHAGSVSVTNLDGGAGATTQLHQVSSSASIDAGAGTSRSLNAYAYQSSAFTLSPSTGLRVTALGTIDVDNPDGAFAQGRFVFDAQLFNTAGSASEFQAFSHDYDSRHGSASTILAGYLYTDGIAREGRFSFNAYAYSYGLAAPVPEPATWGMLAGGLGLIGAMADGGSGRAWWGASVWLEG